MSQTKILIVEDEAIVAADLASTLTRLGYSVVGTASQGETGIALMDETKPDVVLMDVRLDGPMDGIQTAELIRKISDTPVIFLTAHSDTDTMVRAKVTMPFAYILKPFTERELEAHIEMAIYRHKTEAALLEQARLLDLSFDAIIVRDQHDRITYWNQGARQQYGFSADEAMGSCIYELLQTQFPEPMENIKRTLRQTGRWEGELVHFCKDGSRVIDLSRWAIDGDSLRSRGYILETNTNITGRKQAEEQLRSLAAGLERRVGERTQELLESQGRLRALATELNLTEQRERKRLAGELHDYLGQLLALSKIKLGQIKQQSVVPLVSKGMGEVQQVLDQALTYTRSLVAQLSPPVLHEFGLLMALEWLADQMKERELIVTLDFSMEHLPLSEERAVLLFQSVRELLMNVVKHAGTKQAGILVEQADNMLRITVADRGRGFDPPSGTTVEASTVVPRFGLFSIRERMLALGGCLEVTSVPGEGTRATLMVPIEDLGAASMDDMLIREPQPVLALQKRKEGLADQQKLRVLIADDHAMVRQGLCGLLDAYAEIEVIGEAANGEEAVTLAGRFQPDIVLMDVSMPKMDGVEATRRIKQEWPGMTVIGLSVHTAGQVEAAMKEAGATAFMNKEAAVDELYQTIQTARITLQHSPQTAL